MTKPKRPELPEAGESSPESPLGEAEAAGAMGAGGALVEPAEEAVGRLEREHADIKDKYVRLAADFDNFRKRMLRERTELWSKAQADLVVRLLDALDDLARFAHVDPSQTDARALHEGVEMVERKLLKELEALGLRRVDQVGVPFDPHQHEAVTMAPAPDEARDHTVGAVLQAGYRLGDALIRPARVQVLTWRPTEPA